MLAFLALLFLTSCQTIKGPRPSSIDVSASDAEIALEISRELQSASLQTQASRFNDFILGELGPESETTLIKSCKRAKQNLFCSTIVRHKEWSSYRKKKLTEPKPMTPKVVTPFKIQFEKNRIKNWKSARLAEKQSLIKALGELTEDVLQSIAIQAIDEDRCPNMPAVATAATIEAFFPEPRLVALASRLFEKAATCFKANPADRENFLVRAALLKIWLKQTSDAIKILKRVRPNDAFAGRALYWLYRLHDESGDRDKALKVYRRLRNQYPFSFHAIVAASENGEDAALPMISKLSATKSSRSKSVRINQVIGQIETLKSLQFNVGAAILVDWILGTSKLNQGLRAYLASLGDYKAQVATIPEIVITSRRMQSKDMMELAYPLAYSKLFESYSNGIDPYLLMSIAWKESKFDPLAISPANARGLMQIAVPTGFRLGMINANDLYDPTTNIRLGANYINELNQKWNGKGYLVLASYNAGEEAVATWLRRYTIDDPLLFIDLIPYRETRDYVGYVLTNFYWYRRLYLNQPVAKIVAPEIARR